MIEAPKECPCCSSSLEWSNDLLYCRNKDCGSTQRKKVEYFASTMKIKGLGPSSIEKLNLNSIYDIYALDLDTAEHLLSSKKLAEKLMEQIELSKSKSLDTILPSFGIPLVGKSATEKLSKVCSSIFDIDEITCQKAGLGPKVTSNLLSWLDTDTEYLNLPLNLEFTYTSSNSNVESKGTVCISGKLNSFKSKQEAENLLKSMGFVVKSSMTKDVTILINESGTETTKTQAARSSGITIITNLKTFLGEFN